MCLSMELKVLGPKTFSSIERGLFYSTKYFQGPKFFHYQLPFKFKMSYPGYQKFLLACDGELRFVGHRATCVRPKADAARGSLFKT